jgi:UPF0271 protein
MTTDINCDLGEMNYTPGKDNDEAIMPYITSANIACGFHAGDQVTMEKTVALAKKYGVAIGAHPGYPDREGFGRNPMLMSNEELKTIMISQVKDLKRITEASGETLCHVKCHGALYNTAATDREMSMVIAKAIREVDSSLIMVGLSGSEMIKAAEDSGLTSASEVFADRAYNDDGSLVSRKLPGSVLHDTGEVIERALRMVMEKKVISVNGKNIPIRADTVCIHGDNPMALKFAQSLMIALRNAGIDVKPLSRK